MKRSVQPDYRFDSEKFSKALEAAIDTQNRSLAQFTKDTGLSYSYLSKYLHAREKDKAPTLQTLQKIAIASKGPRFADLLDAAGYDASKYDEMEISTPTEQSWYLLNSLIPTLEKTGYRWELSNSDVLNNGPYYARVQNTPFGRWYFVPVIKEKVSKEDISAVFVRAGAETIQPDAKVTFLTTSRTIFDQIRSMEFPLISLRISVALVNVSTMLVVDEQYLASNMPLTELDMEYVMTHRSMNPEYKYIV